MTSLNIQFFVQYIPPLYLWEREKILNERREFSILGEGIIRVQKDRMSRGQVSIRILRYYGAKALRFYRNISHVFLGDGVRRTGDWFVGCQGKISGSQVLYINFIGHLLCNQYVLKRSRNKCAMTGLNIQSFVQYIPPLHLWERVS